MGWLKRNLFFVISVVIALLLLAVAIVYDFKGLADNSAQKARLNEIYIALQNFGDQKPSPGNGKINNIQTAKEQEGEIRAWIDRTMNYFQPIEPIPNLGRMNGGGFPNRGRMGGGGPNSGRMNSEAFANALRREIHELQQEAASAGVTLPPDESFSFTAQKIRVQFAPGSLEPLAVQLGEVKAVSEILFAAHVNAFDGIQRVRVSDDDTAGPQADYVNGSPATNDLAIVTPYVVTFRSFSGELASVLAGFASSPHGFMVKGINVLPTEMAAPDTAPASPVTMAATRRGGLPTVLDEKLLRVTLQIEIVKLK
jgi:hypothetical protein